MINNWYQELDNGSLVGAVFLDFSAAFDLINHDLLIAKLRCYGLSTRSLFLIKDYLSDRSQRVFYNSFLSNSSDIHCGLPQGSCLGPLLFSVYTNDLPYALNKSSVVMYADDSTMYYSNHDVNEISSVLEKELAAVLKWVNNNNMILNVSKTRSMLIGSKQRLHNNTQLILRMEHSKLEQVQPVRLLGVMVDLHLSWSPHINHVISQMGKASAVVRMCSYFVTSMIIKQVVQSLVFSHLEYCSII